ncbi:MAG TPA: glycoside hydrolase family 2 TIM barrel-domain containing protein [Deinococcales bacterium]|nr:glycoside hydrolase family 2 TIM barrel-domain containing protein [Deinococcales bacterium]
MTGLMSLNAGPEDAPGWKVKPFLGEDWVWRNVEKPDTRDRRAWIPAQVPGSILADAERAGLVDDLNWELNTLKAEWVADRTWVYRREFDLPEGWAGRELTLTFEGLDYEASVYLNGALLGPHASMFVPISFDVTAAAREGRNLLAVVLEPAPPEQPQVSRTSRVATMKSRMTYGWDFCPRAIHLGIWRGVTLRLTGPARLEAPWLRPAFNPETGTGTLRVEQAVLPAGGAAVPDGLRVRVTVLGPDGTEAATAEGPVQDGRAAVEVPVPAERAWWPNGFGEQPIYRARVDLLAGNDTLDRQEEPFGFRTLILEPNPGGPADALPYTFTVNGRPIPGKGWNWVPPDIRHGAEAPGRVRQLLELARDAGVTLLRVWGGGLIESREFYDACNELGLMVWQEFPLSSSGIENTPSENPEYLALLAREAAGMVPLARNHPSLAVWCGGNELTGPDGAPLGSEHPAIAALLDVVQAADPGRAWLPTSSSGPVFSNTLETNADPEKPLHDVHGPWEHQGLRGQYTLYNAGTSLMHSEFGVEGFANPRTFAAHVAPDRRWPATKDNPVYEHRGSWWNNEPLVQEMSGGLDSLDELVAASQFLQAEGLRYALEADRRRWPRCSAVIPWQFNEPYPNLTCTSAVDYHGRPKPAYWAVRQAYSPRLLSARFGAMAWNGAPAFAARVFAQADQAEELPLTVTARVLAMSGGTLGEAAFAWTPATTPQELGEVAAPVSGLPHPAFVLDLSAANPDGEVVAAARYPFSATATIAPLLKAPPARLTWAIEPDGDAWTVRLANRGPWAALSVTIEDDLPLDHPGHVRLSDGLLTLLPGETATLRAEWRGVPEAERALHLRGLNVQPARLGLEGP